MNPRKPIYFKSLNGIRAIAAFIVVIWHIDQFSYLFNIEPLKFHHTGMAVRAVDMFFVLSGFLITYLLLMEKELFKNINIKNFYIRRIYRIWPLYYFSLLVSIVFMYFEIIPTPEDNLKSILLYIFLLANVSYALGIQIKAITPLWSVGVEEQYYLLWPNIINKTKNFFLVFVLLFCFVFLVKFIAVYTIKNEYPVFVNFLYNFKINIMIMGALGALWVKEKNKILNIIYRKEVQIIAWGVLLFSCLVKPIHIRTYIDSEINSVFYLIIIINVATNPKTLISLENKIMNFLGKISYGIYVYHMILIFLLSFILKKNSININYFTMTLTIIILTICIANLSYIYFEKPFLNMKKNFMLVKSTNSILDEK